jgi:hypothetical protein
MWRLCGVAATSEFQGQGYVALLVLAKRAAKLGNPEREV